MSNMYPEVKTWNPLGGECPHDCEYCYREDLMRFPANKKKYSGEPRHYKDHLPKTDKTVFVCSMADLFAEDIQPELITSILNICCEVPNTYLLQTKNPGRIHNFIEFLPPKVILGTTIETNRQGSYKSNAPSIRERALGLHALGLPKMVSIEPILDFAVPDLLEIIMYVDPAYVSIGADSKRNNLPEPPAEKVWKLISELRTFTEVRTKSNLGRLLK